MTDAKTSKWTQIGSWIFRSGALREARASLTEANPDRARAVAQVRLLVEVARRVAEPAETLPAGDRSPVLMSLYRDALYWALFARWSGARPPAPDLETLWSQTPEDILVGAARDATALGAVKEAIFTRSAAGSAPATEDDVTRARTFVESLLWDLDAPTRRVDQVLLQRWSRVIALGVLVLVVAVGLRSLILGPNLADGKPFTTSSTFISCANPTDCDGFFFHTNPEASPWVEFDLGTPKKVHRIEVKNRTDCCAERAIPLVAEVSLDRSHWTQVAERKEDFDSWIAKFPSQTARYVRLRVARPSTFHLREVVIR